MPMIETERNHGTAVTRVILSSNQASRTEYIYNSEDKSLGSS